MLVPVAAMLFVYLYGKRAGGGMSPFGATGAQRGASADVKEKIDFSFKQIHVNYTFELIDKIDLSPSPTTARDDGAMSMSRLP